MTSLLSELQAERPCDFQAANDYPDAGQATVRHMQALVSCDVSLSLGLCSELATHIV